MLTINALMVHAGLYTTGGLRAPFPQAEMVNLWAVLVLSVFAGLTTSETYYPPPPLVATSDGVLSGTYMKTRNGNLIASYLGIPYATPPLGDLRFEPARPAPPWQGVRQAVQMPPACLQNKTDVGPMSEDCLYLNVFTPANRVNPTMPVMVFIHGGAFETNSISLYTPEYLLDEQIVYVAIQYRLGLFGYLSTGDRVAPGNQGLKDKRLGLRWVQRNILNFGGDPSKVTLFSHSSGGAEVHTLLIYLSKTGLFRAGICESGVSLLPTAFYPPKSVADTKKALMSLSGCPSDSQRFIDCLKQKPAEYIVELLTRYKYSQPVGQLTGGSLPGVGLVLEPDCVKDRIVTSNPWDVQVNIPWMVGALDAEFLLFDVALVRDKTDTLLKNFDKRYNTIIPLALNYQYSSENGSGIGPATRQFYLDNQPISRATFPQLTTALSDAFFIYPLYEAAKRSNIYNTYFYYYQYIGANHLYGELPPNEIVGAAHGDELFMLFPHAGNITNVRKKSKRDDQFSKKFVKLWVNFATYLNPTPHSVQPIWKTFGNEENFYNFGQDFITANKSFLPKRMRFWENEPYPYRDDKIEPPSC